MIKFEMHAHTRENDIVVTRYAPEIVRMYHEAGYSGMVITNHYFVNAREWYEKELANADQKAFVDFYLRGYYAARDAGEKWGMKILPGAELRFAGPNINDYLIYGIEEKDLYELPLLYTLDLPTLRKLLPADALIVHAHPFRTAMTVTDPDLVDGIEVYNGGTDAVRNRFAEEWAQAYHKIRTSGSDYHVEEHLARGGILLDDVPQDIHDLVRRLRTGNYGLIADGAPMEPIA